MRVLWLRLGILALTVTVASPGHARELAPSVGVSGQERSQDQGSWTKPVLAGIGLGAAGFLAGGLIGGALSYDSDTEYSGLAGAFIGSQIGGTLGMATGAHLGNHRRGNLALDFLTGAAIWGAGIGLVVASQDATVGPAVFVVIPIAQILGTVAVERAVGQRRLRRGDIAVAVVPTASGGAVFVASVAF